MLEIENAKVREYLDKKKFAHPDKKDKVKKTVILGVAGLFIGFVNGLFGAGGGMLAVPLLTAVAGLNTKRSHATAILVILPLCLVSAVIYLSKGVYDKGVFPPTILGVVMGGLMGAYALKKCNNIALQILFYGVMLLAGFKMIF